MDSRERLKRIIGGESADRCGLWLGNPHAETWPIYHKHFGTQSEEDFRKLLQDDFRWMSPQLMENTYRHPQGKDMFDVGLSKKVHSKGPLSEVQDIQALEDFEWPNVKYLHFEHALKALKNAGPYYRASGFWTCFYHNIMDLFGMEAYMMNMFLNPVLVHEVTDRVCQFYYDANELFFEQAGDEVDGFFFGNDFGTQLDLICGPAQFDEFIMPWFKKFTAQGHAHGYQVILHSCGAISRVIERLIEAGVDCLHPIQALAAGMDADSLARQFKGKIAFMGGIDTQELLVNASPEEIRADVRRVKGILGPKLIISPSHEALLPNVPPENVRALAEAALE
jgi:uroporphyrinogen decarboxylase